MRRIRSDSVLITVNGITKSVTQWARDTGKPRQTIEDRLVNGWDPVDAVLVPRARRGTIRDDNIMITIGGVTKNVAEWSRETGRPQGTIKSRIRSGWDPADAVLVAPAEYAQLNLKDKQRYALQRARGRMDRKRNQR